MQFKIIYNPKNVSISHKTEVQIECYYNRKYKYIGTGVYIEPNYWDKDKRAITAKHPQSSTVNNIIKTKLRELETLSYKTEDAGGVFDFNALKNLTGGKDKQTFCNFIAECLKDEPELELNSIVKYKYNIEIIRGVLSEITIDKLTADHIQKLDVAYREKYADSTVARLHIFTEKYIKKAVIKKLLRENPYDKYKLPKFKAEPKKTMHTMAELDALAALDLTHSVAMIRDRYLFSCYTGLRISDNLALLKTNIADSADGYVVSIRTIKGIGHDLILPIGLMFDGRADAIARRWMTAHDEKTLFPAVSRTYISTVLTILAEMAKIDKHLTFHVARHTCASLLADISSNPFLIMEILGHAVYIN
jgi:site-specific recombinase XerD